MCCSGFNFLYYSSNRKTTLISSDTVAQWNSNTVTHCASSTYSLITVRPHYFRATGRHISVSTASTLLTLQLNIRTLLALLTF